MKKTSKTMLINSKNYNMNKMKTIKKKIHLLIIINN